MAGIDNVDIGGAAARGRPVLPPIRTVEADDSGNLNDIKPRENIDTSKKIANPMGMAVINYPEDHPINNDELSKDGTGAVLLGRGEKLSKSIEVIGDVRKGYVTGQAGSERKKEAVKVLEALAKEEDVQEKAIAKSTSEKPLIEVIYVMQFGAIVSYYNKVVEEGKWLILITDNREAASQKFIPTMVQDDKGNIVPFTIKITGKDRKTTELKVVPLNINFTVDNYDFSVLCIAGN